MSQKSYVLVINLKSRQAANLVSEIKKLFADKKSKIKIITVKDPAKLNASFQKAIDINPDVIVLGGGDGTLISGIEYLLLKNYKKKIGLLPLGTANYLARDLSIPLDLADSIGVLVRGKSRSIPLGVANNKYFALTFILGLTQRVAENVSDNLKQRFGQLAYVVELFNQSKHHKAFNYVIKSPSLKKPLTGITHQITVYNSDINQQLKLVPDHELEKPALKVVVSRCGKSKTRLYISFLTHIITLGKIRPYMYVFDTQSLEITTTPAVKADYDGEVYGKGPFNISLSKHRAKIIC